MRKQTKILCMQCTKTATSISPSHTNCCNKFHAQTQPTCLQRRISAGPTVLTRPGSTFGPLRTPTNTAQDTTITQRMPGQHVQASLHTYRHSTGHHDHTKYDWPACTGLFAHLQTQHRTPRSHKVYLASMFRPLCTPTDTAQDTTITQSMPGQYVQASLHTYRHSTGHHDHTKYTWPVCSGLFAHLQDTTITQSMPGKYVQTSSHTYIHSTGHHTHTKYTWSASSDLFTHTYKHNTTTQDTKYTWSACSDLFTHLQAQHTTITQSMPGQHVWTSAHLQAQHRTSRSHKVCLVSMFGPLHTYRHSTGHHDHTKYAWSACLDLCTPSGTAHDITIAQSMPGQHVWTSSHTVRHNRTSQSHKVCLVNMFGPVHTYRHSTGHHNHTKHALSACSDLRTLSGTAQDTTITTKYALSARSDLCMPSGTSQSHKVWRFRATLHSKRFQEHQCHNEPKPCRLLWRSDWVTSLSDCVTVPRPQPAWTTSLYQVWNHSIGNHDKVMTTKSRSVVLASKCA